MALNDGPLRYSELLNTVRAQTPVSNWPGDAHRYLQEGILSRTLQSLTQGELIERDRAVDHPYATTYHLAPPARELLTAMVPAAEWTEAHAALVTRVQGLRQRMPADE
ncbi:MULTISPECIES: winged helix-turn-helix transcriptional regulator [Streptomyces]|uniref:winged helix-turn-helix transcriptional regulator n=1 Tax=Streptomyces sp. SYP-A7185 TaxID=3040076 RepID=UPI0038F78EAF